MYLAIALHVVLVFQVSAAPVDQAVATNGTNQDHLLIVKTNNGPVRGTMTKTPNGDAVIAFLGIPFAKPPVGELRFKKPVPIGNWTDVFNATKLPNSCQQESSNIFPDFRGEAEWNPNTNVSEDCLYLNVWVPAKLRHAHNATVLLWIYGGGFSSGTSTLELYDGTILAGTNNVIVASINYRVGIFGFLYLGNDEAPGNVGLLDQTMAIQWVKNNSRHFGGDPESLTVFGESAGGASVSLQLVSPVSGSLFKRAIMQSGSFNAPWSSMLPGEALATAADVIQAVGCNKTVDVNTTSVAKCMRGIDARNLSAVQFMNADSSLDVQFGPIIDGVFLPKDPVVMLNEGSFANKDILLGSNLDEGSYWLLYDNVPQMSKDRPTYVSNSMFDTIIESMYPDWSGFLRAALKLEYTEKENLQSCSAGVKRQKILSNIMGDYLFVCPLNQFADKMADGGAHVYHYRFTQRSSNNPWGEWMGVLHGDEIEYVFGRPLIPTLNYTAAEQNLSRRMMSYYVNFAKTGKPLNNTWPTYCREKPNYFVLNAMEANGTLRRGPPRSNACSFWNEKLPLLLQPQAG